MFDHMKLISVHSLWRSHLDWFCSRLWHHQLSIWCRPQVGASITIRHAYVKNKSLVSKHRFKKLDKKGVNLFLYFILFWHEKIHSKVHFVHLYVDVQNTLLSVAEIFSTWSKVNLLCIGGGEVSGGEVSGGEVSGGEVSGGEVSGGEVSGGEDSGGEVSGGVVLVNKLFNIHNLSLVAQFTRMN